MVAQQNAANAAAFKANEEKKAQAAIKAAQEAEAAKRELQEQTIKQFEEARTKLDLSLQEKEITNGSIKLKLENEKAYVEESLKLERYRLEQGLISQQEFANREQAFQLGVLRLEQQMREEQDRTEKERKALDEANLKELQMANIANEYELRQATFRCAIPAGDCSSREDRGGHGSYSVEVREG